MGLDQIWLTSDWSRQSGFPIVINGCLLAIGTILPCNNILTSSLSFFTFNQPLQFESSHFWIKTYSIHYFYFLGFTHIKFYGI